MLRLKELRLEHEMTQSKLASLLGLNQTAIGKYERKELEPNLQNLITMADYFQCTVDYLIGRSDDLGIVHISPPSNSTLSKEEQEVLQLFKKLNRDSQYRTIGFMKKLADADEDERQLSAHASPTRKEDTRGKLA